MAHLSHDLDDEQPVCISVKGNTLTVYPDPVPISIQAKHRAHWFLAGEGTIDSVTFAPGLDPFQAAHNIPKSKKHVLSDTVINKGHVGKHFKYTVVVTLPGGKLVSLDPDVEVQT
ncbi:MAG TPA: hypothetical protein VF395_16530 [Polyangiaceae bacterium]